MLPKKKLDFENLRDVVWISSPSLSGDGKRAAYVKGISDYASGMIHTLVAEINLETGEEWVAEKQDMCQKEPVYSPDGKFLAFLSSDGGPWQVWVRQCENGNVRQLTHFRYGASSIHWSKDGSKVAFEITYYPELEEDLFAEMTKEAYQAFLKERKQQPKVIENLIYKLDSAYGMLDGSRTAVGICRVDTGECSLASPLDMPYKVPSFVQDGKKLACYAYPYSHCKELNSEICLIDLQTGTVDMVKKTVPSYYSFPLWENKGKIVYCGVHVVGPSAMPELYEVEFSGGESTLLFETWPKCHGMDPLYCGDTHLSQEDCPVTVDEEGNFYFVSYYMGRSNVFCWNGKNVFPVTDEECVLSFSGPVNGNLLVLKSEWNKPAYLSLFRLEKTESGELKATDEKQLTFENQWLKEYELTRPVKYSVESKDGKSRIYGWGVVPEHTPGEKIPAVLDVHGGPEGCYINGFFYEAQMMAARGMAVLYCDPRGSAGYGPEFMDEAYAYGKEAVEDYQAFLYEGFKLWPDIDPSRVGVTGGSYGGHMTNKLISVTDDFAAAVTQRTWVNPSSSYGTGDMGFYSSTDPQTISFKEYMKNRVRKSIMKDIRNVHVPVLILHGEKDYRCALEQGEQVYHVLRSLKPELPVKIVIFPEENHGVTREGKMHNQIRHMKEMTEWFEEYLGGQGQ